MHIRVHNVSQWPNLRHLGEPLEGATSLLEAVSFNKATESMGRERVTHARWESVPETLLNVQKSLGGLVKYSITTGNQTQLAFLCL